MQIVNLSVGRSNFSQLNIAKVSKNVFQNPENTSECNKDFVDRMNYCQSVNFKSINFNESASNYLSNQKSAQDFNKTEVVFNGRLRTVGHLRPAGHWRKKVDVLKPKDEIQEIIKSAKSKIQSEKDILKKSNMIENMVKDCLIDQGDYRTAWSSLANVIKMDPNKAILILEEILMEDESRNKTVNELVKEMTVLMFIILCS